MKSITRQSELVEIGKHLLIHPELSIEEQAAFLQKSVFFKKVRFHLLDFFGRELYHIIPLKSQPEFLDLLIESEKLGVYPVTGTMLQKRLSKNFSLTLKKAETFIVNGDEWYICDIIGERVFGVALLNYPEKTLPYLQKLAKHPNKWMVRTIGVAGHYAIKKGLLKIHAERLFQLLLSLSDTTDFHTKKGIGWAAKTTAKFHPDIIKRYEAEIASDSVKQWFRTKVKIGLTRSFKYATKYQR